MKSAEAEGSRSGDRPLVDLLRLERDSRFRAASEEIVAWLAEPTVARVERGLRGWSDDDLPLLELALSVQAIAPALDAALPGADGFADGLPRRVRTILRERRELNRERAERARALLVELLGLFGRERLRALPLKGALFAFAPGFDSSLRVSADLDFLVEESDSVRAGSILAAAGFSLRREFVGQREFAREPVRIADPLRGEHPDNPIRVELHTRLASEILGLLPDPAARLRAGARDGELVGVGARLPSEGDLFAHLLVHHTGDLLNHGLRAGQLLDLPVVWERVRRAGETAPAAAAARELLGSSAPLFPTLGADLLPSVVPRDLLEALGTPPPRLLAFFRGRPLLRFARPSTLRNFDYLLLADDWRGRAGLLRTIFLPGRDRLRRAFGDDAADGTRLLGSIVRWYARRATSLVRRLASRRPPG